MYKMKPTISNVYKINFCLKTKFSVFKNDIVENQRNTIFGKAKSFPKPEILCIFAESGLFE